MRATKWWEEKGFLIKQDMGLAKSTAYHPQWNLFELFWIALQKDIEGQKEAWRNVSVSPCSTKGQHACSTKGQHDESHHAATHESQRRISKEESHPEWAPSPSALDANVISSSEGKVKEGIQGEQVESTEPQHTPPAEPFSPETDYEAVVEEALSRHPLYFELLGWDELNHHLVDAAASERRQPGAGVALVVERFSAAQKEVGT